MNTLIHILGLDGSGYWANFWGGIGNGWVQPPLFLAGYVLYRKHNCHVKGCWRIQRHAVEGTQWVVCKKHHPTGSPTHQEVLDQHQP